MKLTVAVVQSSVKVVGIPPFHWRKQSHCSMQACIWYWPCEQVKLIDFFNGALRAAPAMLQWLKHFEVREYASQKYLFMPRAGTVIIPIDNISDVVQPVSKDITSPRSSMLRLSVCLNWIATKLV